LVTPAECRLPNLFLLSRSYFLFYFFILTNCLTFHQENPLHSLTRYHETPASTLNWIWRRFQVSRLVRFWIRVVTPPSRCVPRTSHSLTFHDDVYIMHSRLLQCFICQYIVFPIVCYTTNRHTCYRNLCRSNSAPKMVNSSPPSPPVLPPVPTRHVSSAMVDHDTWERVS